MKRKFFATFFLLTLFATTFAGPRRQYVVADKTVGSGSTAVDLRTQSEIYAAPSEIRPLVGDHKGRFFYNWISTTGDIQIFDLEALIPVGSFGINFLNSPVDAQITFDDQYLLFILTGDSISGTPSTLYRFDLNDPTTAPLTLNLQVPQNNLDSNLLTISDDNQFAFVYESVGDRLNQININSMTVTSSATVSPFFNSIINFLDVYSDSSIGYGVIVSSVRDIIVWLPTHGLVIPQTAPKNINFSSLDRSTGIASFTYIGVSDFGVIFYDILSSTQTTVPAPSSSGILFDPQFLEGDLYTLNKHNVVSRFDPSSSSFVETTLTSPAPSTNIGFSNKTSTGKIVSTGFGSDLKLRVFDTTTKTLSNTLINNSFTGPLYVSEWEPDNFPPEINFSVNPTMTRISVRDRDGINDLDFNSLSFKLNGAETIFQLIQLLSTPIVNVEIVSPNELNITIFFDLTNQKQEFSIKDQSGDSGYANSL